MVQNRVEKFDSEDCCFLNRVRPRGAPASLTSPGQIRGKEPTNLVVVFDMNVYAQVCFTREGSLGCVVNSY